MSGFQKTQVSPIQVRSNVLSYESCVEKEATPEWTKPIPRRPGERFLRNFAVASALVLCAVALRTGALPSLTNAADVVFTAATDQSLLDEQLGKLSFVSSLFPEAILVFGETSAKDLVLPVSVGDVVHVWSEAEPYMAWQTAQRNISSVADGEVIGVYHGNGDERLVQVMGHDGIACLYGNLAEVNVRTGDSVSVGDILGTLQPGTDLVLEVRSNGKSIDPSIYLFR